MRPRRLEHILAGQWIAFALSVAVLCGAAALLLLFLLEDRFIDRRLHEVAAMHAADPAAPLPPRFAWHALDALPTALQRATTRSRLAEFRADDGRYVHVLRQELGGRAGVLVYDVTDQLDVNAGLRLLAPWLAALYAALGLLAWLFARGFMRRTAARAQALVERVQSAPDPVALRAAADAEPVVELATLARQFADAWQSRSDVLQRERQVLAYLAHELRTPLQAARTELALLEDAAVPERVRARLRNAVDRLARASGSVLWLSSDADPRASTVTLRPLLQALVDAHRAQAGARGQVLALEIDGDPRWRGPAEVLEAVAANLLQNAIRHGAPGRIEIDAGATGLTVRNRRGDAPDAGFGIGLAIVERLCARCGWSSRLRVEDDTVEHRIEAGA
jgi:signal transduction histidine kinase